MFRDRVHGLYQGVLYPQNVVRFRGTRVSVIPAQESLAQPSDTVSHIPEISVLRRTDVSTQ
jgi:hypothetical protein